MRNLIKRIARRILRQELFDKDEEQKRLIKENVKLIKELQEYLSIKEELEDCRRIRYIIPEFIICGILNVLPNPNIYAKGISGVIKSNYQDRIYHYRHNCKDGGFKIATFKFLFLGDNGITLELCDLCRVIFIPLVNVDKMSIMTNRELNTEIEVTTFAWDINNLGISVIDGKSYDDICSCISAKKEVCNILNNEKEI